MEYDFLKQFSKRMKIVGMFSTLIKNSWQKTTWKQFGFETMDEQVNMIYAVLLFIMEYSLREQPCTIDDKSVFVDDVCNRYLKKSLSYEKSRELAMMLSNDYGISTELWDERLTTVLAYRLLDESQTFGKKRKSAVDTVSATVILEDYLKNKNMA